MKQLRHGPKHAVHVTTYSDLQQWIDAFARGVLNLLILIGGPGLAKSRLMRDAVGPQACWIEGHATALGMFIKLFRHRNELAIIDDVDSLYSDRSAVRLLKTLCQTDDRKRLAWHSQTAALDREAVPQEFVTTTRVAIIANEWSTLNENVKALEDRGHVLVFEPTALEVHSRVAEKNLLTDQQVFDFIGDHLHLISAPSMRDYFKGAELNAAGLEWKKPLLARWGLTEVRLLVAALMADDRFATERERVDAFVKAGGGSVATYYNHKKLLERPFEVPKFQLSSPEPQAPDPDILSILRRRHGHLGNG